MIGFIICFNNNIKTILKIGICWISIFRDFKHNFWSLYRAPAKIGILACLELAFLEIVSDDTTTAPLKIQYNGIA